MTDGAGASSQVLLQTFTLPGPGVVTLSFDYFRLDASNGAGQPLPSPPPDSLDYHTLDDTGQPNQQARVDILTLAAGGFDLGASVVYNVLLTTPNDLGDPNGNTCYPEDCSYQHLSVDLTPFIGAGGTYQLRLASVFNIGEPFVFGVDNVAVDYAASVPEPSSAVGAFAGLLVILSGNRRVAARTGGTRGKQGNIGLTISRPSADRASYTLQ